MAPKQFQNILLQWYSLNKRDLPWRSTQDPYKIWLSEIILQQTRISQGLPYYYRFIESFPTVYNMALATEPEILRLWQGLGYYSRARNLHSCAREIVQKLNGNFPKTYKELIKLKGIGSYTAAAIASFAYREKVAVVDGNVMRMLSRIFGITDDISSTSGKKAFQNLANCLINPSLPDIHNQAMMDFGALQCTPANPECQECVFNNHCIAFLNGIQKTLPVNNKKIKIKNRYFYYLALEFEGRFFMKKRTEKDIWNGLHDFYLIEKEAHLSIDELENPVLKKLLSLGCVLENESNMYQHKLTHQALNVQFLHIKINDKGLADEISNFPNFGLYAKEEIISLPKPILIHKYLKDKLNMLN